MKKLTSVLITAALLLTMLFTLSSCSHECTFSSEWSTDESSHWHVCTVKEDCIECSDKADHSWNEGEITTKPTVDTEGVMTYLCTVCDYKREEALPKCDFNGEWLTDEASHWHVCANDGCEEIGDKAVHTWDDGKITTEPTQEADGVKTYTCTECKTTKEEAVEFLGLDKAEWDKLFADDRLDNYTYTELASVKTTGLEVQTKLTVRFTKHISALSMELMGEIEEEVFTGNEATILKGEMANSIQKVFAYDSFEYDTEEKVYIMKEGCELEGIANLEGMDINVNNAKVRINNANHIELIILGDTEIDGIEMEFLCTVTLNEFGTTTLDGSSSSNVSPL